MDDQDFEGTIVLEKLARIGQVEEFFAAVDAEDLKKASRLMEAAGIDQRTIAITLRKITEGDEKH
jgi:hypothetical protein